MKNKTKIVFAATATLLLTGAIILIVTLTRKKDIVEPLTPLYTQQESLSNASKSIDFALFSTKERFTDSSSYSIFNQQNEEAKTSLSYVEKNRFLILPPKTGYTPGDTYNLTLLSDYISFENETFIEKREITFTIFREDTSYYSVLPSVKTIKIEPQIISYNNQIINSKLVDNNKLKVGNIIIVPVVGEYGFTKDIIIKITKISGDTISYSEPDYLEVYKDINVRGSYDAVYERNNFNFYDEKVISKEILENGVVRKLVEKYSDIPEISIKQTLSKDGVTVNYSVVFVEFYASLDLVLKGTIKITLGSTIDINFKNGSFVTSVNNSFSHTYSLTIFGKKFLNKSKYNSMNKLLKECRISSKIIFLNHIELSKIFS